MKQTLTTVLIFICLFTNAQTDFDKYKNLVKEEMEKWFIKGEFEKQSEYLERINETYVFLDYAKLRAFYDFFNIKYNLISFKNANRKNTFFDRYSIIFNYSEFKYIDNINLGQSYNYLKPINYNPETEQIETKFYYGYDNQEFKIFNFSLSSKYAKLFKQGEIALKLFPISFYFEKNEIKINNALIYKSRCDEHFYYIIDESLYSNDSYPLSADVIYLNKLDTLFEIFELENNSNFNINPCKYYYKMETSLDNELKRSEFDSNTFTLADLNIPLSEEVKAIVYNQSKTIIPAVLTASNIGFTGSNNTNTLIANKKSNIHFTLTNTGKGVANKLTVKITDINNTVGLSYKKEIVLGSLEPNTNKDYSIDVLANLQTPNAQAKFKIEFSEENGFYPDPIEIAFNTTAFVAPKLQIMDYSFLSNTGKLEKAKPIVLKALLQNIGQGVANNIEVSFTYPNANVFNTSTNTFKFTTIEPNETKELLFEFVTNKNYTANNIPITIHVQESFKQFAEDKNVVATLAESVGTSVSVVANNQNNATTTITPASLFSDVDKNIPTIAIKNPHKYALIIGNEDYSSRQANVQKESNVPFAINDAKTFKDYCINTLAVEEENVFLLFNATAGEMASKIELVTEIVKRLGNKAELIVYYAGHGYPDEKTKAPYLIPVDVPISNLNTAIKLNDVYQKLSKTNAQKITIFLDACFTGGGREEGLITGARGVKIVPNEDALTGNLVVFSATTNDQSALPYKEKQHGIFTYYLLKALQINNGKIQLSELEKYVKEQVSIQSLKVNNKAQDPTIKLSETVKQQYLNWTF